MRTHSTTRLGRVDWAVLVGFAAYGAGLIGWLGVGLVPAVAAWFPRVERFLDAVAAGDGLTAEFARRASVAADVADHPLRVLLEYAFSTVNLVVSLALLTLRPRDRLARLLALGMMGTAATFNHQSHSAFAFDLLGAGPWVANLHLLFHVVSGVGYLFAVVLFPDGEMVPRARGAQAAGWRLVYVLVTLQVVATSVSGRTSGHPGQGYFVAFFGLAVPTLGVVAQSYKLRRSVDVEQRQQARLLRRALVPTLLASVTFAAWRPPEDVRPLLFASFFALVPVALVVGMLRYRLWSLELVALRATLAGALVLIVSAMYVAVVAVVGSTPGAGSTRSLLMAAIATAVVATVLEPGRARVQAATNRVLLGRRNSPSELASRLAERLGPSLPVAQVLTRVAEVAGATVGGTAAEARVFGTGGEDVVASWPSPSSPVPGGCVAPVIYSGNVIGRITVTRDAGRPFGPNDERNLAELAAQAGPAFDDVRLTTELERSATILAGLTEDLRASRRRLLNARIHARREAGEEIRVAVASRVEHTRQLLERARLALPDGRAAAGHLDDALEVAASALDALRNLARGLFPVALTGSGLEGALRASVGPNVRLRIDPSLMTRPNVEAQAGVYFCVDEALRGADGQRVSLSVSAADDQLRFTLTGGVGAAACWREPIALRDRMDALGGSLSVRRSPRRLVVEGAVPLAPPREPAAAVGA